MRALIGLMVVLLLAGSIPILWGDEGARGERGDPLVGAPPARGNTIIVDINGTGDYTSIQEAIDSAQDGDTIRIWAGTYYERIGVKSNLKIIGNQSKTFLRLSGEQSPFIISSNVTLCSLDIENSYLGGDGIEVYGDDVRITDCRVHSTVGIRIGSSQRSSITSVRFDDCIQPIHAQYSRSLTLSDNIAENYGEKGLFIFDTRGLTMYDNHLINCSIAFGNNEKPYANNDIPTNNTINSVPILFVSDKEDVKVEDIYSQMFFYKCGSVSITGSKIDKVDSGMTFYYCDDIRIEGASFENISQGSIVIHYSKNVELNNINTFWGSYILIDEDDSLIVENMTTYRGDLDIRTTRSVDIHNNHLEFMTTRVDEQVMDKSSYVFVNNNIFNNSRLEIVDASSSFVQDNEFYCCSIGVLISGSNCSISDNTFRYCGYGIEITNTAKGLRSVKNCQIYNSTIGISVTDAYDIRIENITVQDGADGIILTKGSCLVANSSFIGNNHTGISLDNVTKTTVVNNDISGNAVGIKCYYTNLNYIYNNRFMNNDNNAVSPNGNDIWSKVPPVGGNYWGDYTGKDQKRGNGQDEPGSDGFGDTSYRISSSDSDRYPIVKDRTPPHAVFTNMTVKELSEFTVTTVNCYDDNLVMYADWTFDFNGEVINKSGLSVKMTFDRPGEVKVRLNVSDFARNYDIAEGKITVMDGFDPIAICKGNITCEEGLTVFFDATGSTDSGNIIKYEWIFNYKGATVFLEGINVSYLFDVPGIVPVILRVTDSAGHIGEDHFTVTVIDITDPLVEAGDDISIDNGEMATLNGSLSTDNGMIVEYNWTFYYGGQLILIQEIVASYLFEKPGIYNITLEVTDQFGNKASDSLTLTVRDTIKPIPVITGLTTFLENENIKLSGKSSTDNGVITNYVWKIEDNGTVTIQGADLDYNVKIRGYHKVFLTVFDEWGNNATVNLTVNAIDSNKPFTAAGPDQDVAVGTTVTLDASGSHDDGTITKYQWTFSYDNQNQELLGKIVSFKFDKPGTYEVTLKVFDDSDNYGIDKVTITVKNTGVVKGIVKDDKGDPVDGALVEIVASDGKTYTFTTAPDGSFSLAIPPGSFTWKISKSGYGTITGSSSVDILGEKTLDLTGTPMKKTTSTGTSPILFIVPAVIVVLLIVGVVIFLVMRKKKSAPETMEVKSEEETIPPEPAQADATADNPPIPPEASEFVQAPPVMEEDVPIEKVEENTTVDDLFIGGSDHGDEESLNSEVS